MITRPMKATTVEIETLDKVKWPAYASPKIDGIRLLIHPELGPVTQSFKRVPNVHIFETLMRVASRSYFDGEVYAIDENGTALFNQTQSAVMSRKGRPSFRYAVFDCFDQPHEDFRTRHAHALHSVNIIHTPEIIFLWHTLIHSTKEFLDYVFGCVQDGYEGVVIRAADAPYKSGRSTLNQGGMLKYKNWADAEGTVIGFEELYHNENPQEVDLLGLSKRSAHGKGKVAASTLGALVLQTEWGELRVGSGFTQAQRQVIWDRNSCGASVGDGAVEYAEGFDAHTVMPDLGRKVTFKYQKHGMQTLPRFPVFKTFRED